MAGGAAVLVLGGGGRELALADALAAEGAPVVVAPGNAGCRLRGLGRAPVDLGSLQSMLSLVEALEPRLVVVGPEGPLFLGLGDALRARGLACFGPDAAAAQIEGSKAWARAFLSRWGLPGPRHRALRSRAELAEALAGWEGLPVLKASGPAGGKGVWLPESPAEAWSWGCELLEGRRSGEAGRELVLEERLVGVERSLIALCDGLRALPLLPCQDHKRLEEGDRGPNTGGMGALCPAPLELAAAEPLLARILGGLAAEGRPFRGALYLGLMVTQEGPKILECNARLGDPETQALLALLDEPLLPLLEGAAQGELPERRLRWRSGAAVAVVAAAAGYPGAPRLGTPLRGWAEAEALPGLRLHAAGLEWGPAGLETAGGRVLSATAWGRDASEARALALEGLERVDYAGKVLRRDIGAGP